MSGLRFPCEKCKKDCGASVYLVNGKQLCYDCVPSGTFFGWKKP